MTECNFQNAKCIAEVHTVIIKIYQLVICKLYLKISKEKKCWKLKFLVPLSIYHRKAIIVTLKFETVLTYLHN